MKLRAVPRNKLNNRGSSIVLVIVALAFVGILAALILWMSYMNYYMKYSDMKATDNFYSAEKVVEQMKTGLQKDASNAMSEAYTAVLQKYSEYTVAERQTYFSNTMTSRLVNQLKGDSAATYNLDKLKSYVDTTLSANSIITGGTGGVCTMTVSTNQIVLKDINVEYTDSRGFLSIIHTDFAITAPEMKFTDSGTMPDLFEYCLIADNSLTGSNTNNVEITGSIYGGNNEKSVVLTGNSDLKVTKAKHFVVGQSLLLEGPSASLTTDENTSLWTKNLRLTGDSGSVVLDGASYIADDLTVDGEQDSVKLSGKYYGYGMDNAGDGSDSSAVLINGKKTTIDMTGLSELWLGGRAYIGTASANAIKNPANKNVPMSESIAVKGNQIAYLAPASSIAVLNGVSRVKSNPMTYGTTTSEYELNVKANQGKAGFVEYDTSVQIPELGEQIKNYSTECQTIFAQGLGGEGLVYYYMVMDAGNAQEYFRNYYRVKADKLDKYLKIYADGIKTGNAADYTRIDIAGNWMTYNGTTVSVNSTTVTDTTPLTLEAHNYQKTFQALNAKLVTNINNVTATELSQNIFKNLIQTSAVEAAVADGHTVTLKEGTGSSELDAVITRESNYIYNGDSKVRLIIATGDVTLNADFEGTVIADGDIILGNGIKIVNDEDTQKDLALALQAKATITGTDRAAYEFFVDGSKYVLSGVGTTVSDPDADNTEVSLDDVVTYENWSKR